MNVVIVENIVYINKRSDLLPRWNGDFIQESELMKKLFVDYYCRFLPFTPAVFYYIYWNNVWRGRNEVVSRDFYTEVVEPIKSIKSYTYVRWSPKPAPLRGRFNKSIKTLVNNSLIISRMVNGLIVSRITEKGIRTAKRELEDLWYYIHLVEYALERDDKELISKLLKIKKFRALTPKELKKKIYYF